MKQFLRENDTRFAFLPLSLLSQKVSTRSFKLHCVHALNGTPQGGGRVFFHPR
jgi:hypothetical protein